LESFFEAKLVTLLAIGAPVYISKKQVGVSQKDPSNQLNQRPFRDQIAPPYGVSAPSAVLKSGCPRPAYYYYTCASQNSPFSS
jgi:hypothetical protein